MNLDELFSGDKNDPQVVVLHGVFECQVCGDDVTEAEYISESHILRWSCVHGHKSHIENFNV